MNTHRTSLIFALIVIALVVIILSACDSPDLVRTINTSVNVATDLLSPGDAPVYPLTVANSPRIKGCSLSERGLILNQVDDHASQYTLDHWLNSQKRQFSCIH